MVNKCNLLAVFLRRARPARKFQRLQSLCSGTAGTCFHPWSNQYPRSGGVRNICFTLCENSRVRFYYPPGRYAIFTGGAVGRRCSRLQSSVYVAIFSIAYDPCAERDLFYRRLNTQTVNSPWHVEAYAIQGYNFL